MAMTALAMYMSWTSVGVISSEAACGDEPNSVVPGFTDTFTWTEIPIYAPSVHCPRLSHTATLISPTQLLILGGHNGTDYKTNITVFSLATGKFYEVTNATALPNYGTIGPTRRGYHTACLHDGRIVFLGGYDGKHHFDELWLLDVVSLACFGD